MSLQRRSDTGSSDFAIVMEFPGRLSVTTIIFPGPGGGVKQVDLDHQLLRDQMVQVSEQRAKEILESWLEFSIGNPDPLQAAQYNEQDRSYFTGLEAAAQKFRVWALEKEE